MSQKKVDNRMAGFRVFRTTENFSTSGGISFVDLTERLQEDVAASGVRDGLVHVFAPHATGILILTEDEPNLRSDLKSFLEQLVPAEREYRHPANAHAHLRSVLFPPDKTIPVIDGHAEFGTWQSLVFVETDVHPRRRTIIVQVLGEG